MGKYSMLVSAVACQRMLLPWIHASASVSFFLISLQVFSNILALKVVSMSTFLVASACSTEFELCLKRFLSLISALQPEISAGIFWKIYYETEKIYIQEDKTSHMNSLFKKSWNLLMYWFIERDIVHSSKHVILPMYVGGENVNFDMLHDTHDMIVPRIYIITVICSSSWMRAFQRLHNADVQLCNIFNRLARPGK